uniref:EF-hand domain-containing protein n=1 Tax=Ciona savignyi TaxID=51511 RepID=H2Z3V7_CIOSA
MKLSPKEEKEFNECFEMFDEEDVGEIPVSDLNRIMSLLGWDPTQSEIEQVIRAAKLRPRGQMKRSEFMNLMEIWCSENKEKHSEEDLAKAFKVFDKDGSGYIEWEELKYVMQGTGEPLTDEEVSAMMKEADKDGDGRIDYQEFVAMMRGDCTAFL